MIKLIIFDWDDVFSQGSTSGYYKCYDATLDELGIELTPEIKMKRIAAKWGSGHRESIGELLKDYPDRIDEACEVYEKHLFSTTFLDSVSVLPGSQELLRRLSKNYILAIASGVHPKLLKEKIMPKFNIPDVFSQIETAYDLDDTSRAKPDPQLALNIMSNQKADHNETIMVGDAKNDVLMARNAQITPVAVLTGHLSREEAEELDVAYVIEDVTMLESALTML